MRDALLAMNLRQVGAKQDELNRLGEAMSSRVGVAAPDMRQVNSLGELVKHFVKDR
ncbi:hypothetical protein ACN28S_02280 [Cystobacter fuscus]